MNNKENKVSEYRPGSRRNSGKNRRNSGGRRRSSLRARRFSNNSSDRQRDNDDAIFKKASVIVDDLTETWALLKNNDAESRIPKFQLSELFLGRILGRGGFCVVNEIKAVKLSEEKDGKENSELKSNKKSQGDAEDSDFLSGNTILQDRSFIASKCIRNGDARYCMKAISREAYEQEDKYFKGVIDLAIESKILAVLKHPNIIILWATCDGGPFQRDNFIILDRLYDTLKTRLTSWRIAVDKPWNRFRKKKTKKLFIDRLMVAYDLSSAFKYLHAHKIIYRDLKPENIGFDVRGDVKLFDFGLAKELPYTVSDNENTLYKLSGQTGSIVFMAPEVALGKPYNLKADAYSFSILLWEMLTLKAPFSGYNVRMHRKMVVDSGDRPKLYDSLSKDIANVLTKCWSENIEERLNFEKINSILSAEVSPVS